MNGPKRQMDTVAKPERVKKIQNVTPRQGAIRVASGNGPKRPPTTKRG